MFTCDMHSDTILKCLLHGGGLRENGYEIDAVKLKKGGALLQCLAAFLASKSMARLYETNDGYVFYRKMADFFKAEAEKNSDALVWVRSMADLRTAEETGLPGIMLTIEDTGAMLDSRPGRLEEAYADGARLMGVIWNFENCLGYPNSTDPAIMAKGLKPFGFETLEQAEALGMAVDVSHLNDGGFWDIANAAKKPFIASHSCCRALCAHPRNLTDEMIRAIAEKGGVVGVNYYGAFLRDDAPKFVPASLVVDHIEHMIKVGGEDLPALGSDYDGMDSELEWKDASGTQLIAEEMEKRGFGGRLVEKICYKNACRFLGDTIK